MNEDPDDDRQAHVQTVQVKGLERRWMMMDTLICMDWNGELKPRSWELIEEMEISAFQ